MDFEKAALEQEIIALNKEIEKLQDNNARLQINLKNRR